jgi:hypothetical protein
MMIIDFASRNPSGKRFASRFVMESPRHQLTIRQVMIGAGILGSILGLGARVWREDEAVRRFVGIALFTFPMWGAFVLAWFKPAVTRQLFRAHLVIAPLLCGCLLLIGAIEEGKEGVFLGLFACLWVLSMIVPFGLGHGLSSEIRRRALRAPDSASHRPSV